MLLARGGDLRAVKKPQGHADVRTKQIYPHAVQQGTNRVGRLRPACIAQLRNEMATAPERRLFEGINIVVVIWAPFHDFFNITMVLPP